MYSKEAYKREKDHRLFEKYTELGLDMDSKDVHGLNVKDYIVKEDLQELKKFIR